MGGTPQRRAALAFVVPRGSEVFLPLFFIAPFFVYPLPHCVCFWRILLTVPAGLFVSALPVPFAPAPRLVSRVRNHRQDIRDVVLEKLPEIESVPKIMVHYINMVSARWKKGGRRGL